MKPSTSSNPILDGYLHLVANLTSEMKLDLIAKLSELVKKEVGNGRRTTAFAQAFGAFESAQTAEEIIAELRASRVFTRQLESF